MPEKRLKKRGVEAAASRPVKKRKKQQTYHSDSGSDSDAPQDFAPVNLDSEDDIANAKADDGAATDSEYSSAPSPPPPRSKPRRKSSGEDAEGRDDSDSLGEDRDASDSDAASTAEKKPSKRNDPSAFANSLSKILSTKLSSTKRSDPLLARSAEAQSSARAAADSALDLRARRHLKEQKLKALEKGRVRDVMAPEEGSGQSVADVLAEERRLRKVAQKGVVKLFNAVRAAQVKAMEAERKGREERVIGTGNREERVNEMSKKGFLDLIASGGGGMKKGALEEA
ncbi:hypothetical protein VUR80DRAFT_5877 [Thermomyces stellatus]